MNKPKKKEKKMKDYKTFYAGNCYRHKDPKNGKTIPIIRPLYDIKVCREIWQDYIDVTEDVYKKAKRGKVRGDVWIK